MKTNYVKERNLKERERKEREINKRETMPLFLRSIKGDMWISWVLLIAFSVVLAAITSNWLQDYAKDSSSRAEDQVERSDTCEILGVSIDFVCQRTTSPKSLNMNITNRKDLKIDRFIVRAYNNSEFQSSSTLNVILKPQVTKNVTVNATTDVDYVEVVPIRIDSLKNKTIMCGEQLAKATVVACS